MLNGLSTDAPTAAVIVGELSVGLTIADEVIEILNNCKGENPIDIDNWFEQYKKK
jgi:hypothetical protein